MSNDDTPLIKKPSAPFVLKDLYKQAEELGLRQKVPAQTKLTLDKQGLGLRLSTGTQLEEPTKMKMKKSCFPKSKTRKAKHTIESIMQHNMHDFKPAESTEEDDDSKQAVMRENDDPNTTYTHENPNFAPPFVVDLLTQEIECDQDSVHSPSACSTATFLRGWEAGGWTNTPDKWVRVFQARSTEGGADIFVDRRAIGDLFRDLASEFSAAKNCG
jgi:hypothetical protein